MPKLTFTECFARYGAKLDNPQWAVSAKSADGAIVISCWNDYFSKPDPSTLRYTDRLSRWTGNAAGNNLLHKHLQEAMDGQLPIRLVIAKAQTMTEVDAGKDASAVPKTFHVKPEVVGRLQRFDGDEFVIDFKRAN